MRFAPTWQLWLQAVDVDMWSTPHGMSEGAAEYSQAVPCLCQSLPDNTMHAPSWSFSSSQSVLLKLRQHHLSVLCALLMQRPHQQTVG